MALIYFYDATELDRQQLSAALEGTDHRWEYVADAIQPTNCDPDTEIISVFVSSTITREIIAALPNLKLIACRSTGFNNVDLEAAQERGISVVNVPTYGEDTVAEYTFALLLTLTRKLSAVFSPEKEDFSFTNFTGTDLAGKTIGIVGTGHIGRKVIRIAKGFSMNIIAHDIQPDDALASTLGFSYVELDELLQRADIVSLHVPYLPTTHHILNDDRLSHMKPGALLVNTARGELVDTKALTNSLTAGHLGGAALDVIEGEAILHYSQESTLLQAAHIPQDTLLHEAEISVLKKMPNVILSPHNAFNTVEAIGRINQTTAQNIIDFWHGHTPNSVTISNQPFGKLLIARHAESEWNATGRWTGVTDVHLSEKGFKDAAELGRALARTHIPIDITYCSQQIRTHETATAMLDASEQFAVDIVRAPELNERDYGDYTGKNKWEIKDSIGEEAFNQLRRGWDSPIPNGETLKMVYERAIPYYQKIIVPLLKEGKNVLIVAHGNSLRALTKYLQNISDEAIADIEMPFGRIDIYDITAEGRSANSSSVTIATSPSNA